MIHFCGGFPFLSCSAQLTTTEDTSKIFNRVRFFSDFKNSYTLGLIADMVLFKSDMVFFKSDMV